MYPLLSYRSRKQGLYTVMLFVCLSVCSFLCPSSVKLMKFFATWQRLAASRDLSYTLPIQLFIKWSYSYIASYGCVFCQVGFTLYSLYLTTCQSVCRDGFVSLQEYMAFMISRETENVQSAREVEAAFRALTTGDKPYITANELFAVSVSVCLLMWMLVGSTNHICQSLDLSIITEETLYLSKHYTYWMYRVAQIKREQLTFLIVTSEHIYKIKRFLAGIHYIEQQVTWCQFYLSETVTC